MPMTVHVMNCGKELPRGFRRLLEKRVDGLLRIAFDNQTFPLWSGLILLAFWLRLRFLRHGIELSYRFLSAALVMVPQPGIGPGRHEWARGCKPRLSANSSTGAHKALNVGAVTPRKVSPAPTYSGPISAALIPSSLSVLRQNSRGRSLPLTFLGFLRVLLFYRFIHRRKLFSGIKSGLLRSAYGRLVHFCDSRDVNHVWSGKSKLRRVTRGFVGQCSFYGRNPFVADYRANCGFFWLYLALLL